MLREHALGWASRGSGLEELGQAAAQTVRYLVISPRPRPPETSQPNRCTAAHPTHLAKAHNVRMPQLHVVCYLPFHILVDVLRPSLNELERHLQRAASSQPRRSITVSRCSGCREASILRRGGRNPLGLSRQSSARAARYAPARPLSGLSPAPQSQRRRVQGPGPVGAGGSEDVGNFSSLHLQCTNSLAAAPLADRFPRNWMQKHMSELPTGPRASQRRVPHLLVPRVSLQQVAGPACAGRHSGASPDTGGCWWSAASWKAEGWATPDRSDAPTRSGDVQCINSSMLCKMTIRHPADLAGRQAEQSEE